MIFSIGDHVNQIFEGTKTQTRRMSHRYLVGREYTVQPKIKNKAVAYIVILRKWVESKPYSKISVRDAEAEGGYTPLEFETLFQNMYPSWAERYCYEFKLTRLVSRMTP